MGHPSVHPTGTTIYDPERAWRGFTLFQAEGLGALLIDMNGREVQLWEHLQGFPNKLLPNGDVLGSTGHRNPQYGVQDQIDLVQVDWEGRIVWRFSELERVADPGEAPRYMARQHHDYQRQGNPVGYFVPGHDPQARGGSTLLLVHEDVRDKKISDHVLLDDKIVEVSWDGSIIWQWRAAEHFDELGFDDAAKEVLRRDPNLRPLSGSVRQIGDWLHINSLSTLGPNRWFAAGDKRFHPDNLIWSAREANLMAIVDKRSGAVVWTLGPRFDGSEAERQLGWIIGQHHVHLIPEGLPGAGNLLLFDNGGWAGYGGSSPTAPRGRQHARRDFSRVLEVDPITLEIIWQYTPQEAGFVQPLDAYRFYSPFISSAQRLPNGNTLITEGSDGRLLEVTPSHEIVWEYINPYFGTGRLAMNMVYRAYRYPYAWAKAAPSEPRAIHRLDNRTFRVPGASAPGAEHKIEVAGVGPTQQDESFCVAIDRADK